MFERGHKPEAKKVAKRLGIAKVRADDRRNRSGLDRGERLGGRRRGQCRGGGLAAPRVVFALLVLATARRLRLRPAGEARPAAPRPRQLSARTEARTPSRRTRLPLRQARIRFRTTTSNDGTVQVVKPGGEVVVTLARDTLPQALPLPHLLLGRARTKRRHRAARPLQAAGDPRRRRAHPRPPPGTIRLHQVPQGRPAVSTARARRRPAVERLPLRRGPGDRRRLRRRLDPPARRPACARRRCWPRWSSSRS